MNAVTLDPFSWGITTCLWLVVYERCDHSTEYQMVHHWPITYIHRSDNSRRDLVSFSCFRQILVLVWNSRQTCEPIGSHSISVDSINSGTWAVIFILKLPVEKYFEVVFVDVLPLPVTECLDSPHHLHKGTAIIGPDSNSAHIDDESFKEFVSRSS